MGHKMVPLGDQHHPRVPGRDFPPGYLRRGAGRAARDPEGTGGCSSFCAQLAYDLTAYRLGPGFLKANGAVIHRRNWSQGGEGGRRSLLRSKLCPQRNVIRDPGTKFGG